MKRVSLSLKNGSTIAVIGAGPAGVFFADFAEQLAREKGLDISIVLFDGKDFTQRGPRGCNLCAGVISETLVERLKGRGIVLPREKVQRKIAGYCLNERSGSFLLTHPLKESRITTVFRGNGPRAAGHGGNISFDDYLLEQVRSKGVKVIDRLVKRIELSSDLRNPARVIYEKNNVESILEADLVVGAFGLSRNMLKTIERLKFGYRSPRTVRARNLEIYLDEDFIHEHFGNNIYTYNLSSAKGMWVASIIPKKEYITVNIVGKRDVTKEELLKFVEHLARSNMLPENWTWSGNLCSCTPRIAVTSARKPFTDRLVMIGDASCSRYYKNGIESAFTTAKLAALTAFNYGISESAFKVDYFKRIRKIIVKDNSYGRILFNINNLVAGSVFLSEVMLTVAGQVSGHRKMNLMRDILWQMYTGNAPYKTIVLKFAHPLLQWELTVTTFKLIGRRIISALKRGSGE